MRYWIGGTGLWSDTAHWSSTSGGSGGASVPGSSDDVYFDTHSFTANGQSVTGGGSSISCGAINFSAISYTASVYLDSDLNTIGDITLSSRLSISGTLRGSGTATFSQNGASAVALILGFDGGTLDLGGDISVGVIQLGQEYNKTTVFNTNNYTITVRAYDASISAGQNYRSTTLNLGSSTINVSAWNMGTFAIVNAGTSTINILDTRTPSFHGMGQSYNIVRINTGSTSASFLDSSTIDNLIIENGVTVQFTSGTTQTINTLTPNGTSSTPVKLRSVTNGSVYSLRKYSGTLNAPYLDVKDSSAIGGATWNAVTSIDSGNNTGWNFVGPQIPVANFTASTYTPYTSATVSFTDTSTNVPTGWAWNFGDGGTSTSQNTTHAYASPGTYTVTLVATNSVGSNTKTSYITVTTKVYTNTALDMAGPGGEALMTYEYDHIDVLSQVNGGGVAQTRTVFQALAEKTYEYRVYTHTNVYLSTWTNITTDFQYDQSINQNASEITVGLARSPDNRIVKIDPLKDAGGVTITDENSDPILVQTSTANSVGPDTDVDINLNVDVYVFYGGYDSLQDENGNDILDSNSEQIIVQFGFPNGKRVYSGYIADYDLTYGDSTGVQALIVPHATELSHYVFMDGSGNTTVSYGSSVDPVKMARDAMDNYILQGGRIGYSVTTMPLSGETNPYDFKLQTPREVLDKTIDLLPSNFYSYTDPGDNMAYILQKGITAKHTFYYQKHINQLILKRSITQLVNDAYYVGGTKPDGTVLFRHSYDPTSISTYRRGLDRQTDGRVTIDASADALSQGQIDQYKMPRYRTSVTIYDTRYDIESIKLGEMVGFKNFDNFADSLVLQIVTIHRAKHSVTLDLDMIVPTDVKRLYELKKELQANAFEGIAVAPSA